MTSPEQTHHEESFSAVYQSSKFADLRARPPRAPLSTRTPGCSRTHSTLWRAQKQWQEQADGMEADSLDEGDREVLGEIRGRKKQLVREHRQKKALHGGNSVMPRSKRHDGTLAEMAAGLEGMGMDADRAVARARSASAARTGRKRERSVAAAGRAASGGDVEMAAEKRQRSSRSRSMSRGALLGTGVALHDRGDACPVGSCL